MTLHEAIEKLLRQTGRPMTTQQIADELNKNGWYQKKDGSKIQAFQIHGRTKNYPNIFERAGSTVSLIGQTKIKIEPSKKEIPKQVIKATQISSADTDLLEKILMNEKNFKSADSIDNLVPHQAGLYCIRIKDINKLPKPFNTFLADRQHNIIYIGIATESLNKRFLNQELRANGHGTFFRSIGAVLGHRPPKGSLTTKKNKRNYKFAPTDEQKIINWINANLKVNWVEFSGDFESFETRLITKYRPLINIAKNPLALQLLTDLRNECVQIANEL
ncbi:GIY-YIG nuclease family protein [Acinetobacter sp.]|uniref:GIY-YIG nuclease family protein n=1 Tax=Acinetobacter sp. TaxID=472 RepID=UPI00258D325D|nr:HTH domain-containing protein [Acinetobacter sp.]